MAPALGMCLFMTRSPDRIRPDHHDHRLYVYDGGWLATAALS
jgi:hypothetical protein